MVRNDYSRFVCIQCFLRVLPGRHDQCAERCDRFYLQGHEGNRDHDGDGRRVRCNRVSPLNAMALTAVDYAEPLLQGQYCMHREARTIREWWDSRLELSWLAHVSSSWHG